MNARVRVVLTDEDGTPFAGIGVIRLLKAIDEHGSINHAAKVCGLSYLKAWNMMNRLDKQLGQPVLDRTSGGLRGGGAVLTDFGRRFLKQFDAYHQRIATIAGTEWRRFSRKLTALALVATLGFSACSRAPDTVDEPDRIHVAAAADLKYAMDEIIAQFHADHPEYTNTAVRATYGSSGNFHAQLVNQAPFDIYFSANMDYPKELIAAGHAEENDLFHYAIGRIVLWTPSDSPIDVEENGITSLFHPSVAKIAIANPRHAPYGVAAEAALRAYGVYFPVQAKLVHGENIAQAAQFIESGAAQIGVIALSLALAPALSAQGVYWDIPMDRYPRMDQGGVILPWTKHRALAEAFRDYVLGDVGRDVLEQYGFYLPGE